MKPLAATCLIDASIYIFQYYFSLPPNWTARNGYSTEAVYGFATFLLKLKEQYGPKRLGLCFDESLGQGFREDIYPDYKASRALPDDSLAYQLDACREIAELMGIPCFGSTRYEADDLIGSLMQLAKRSKQPVAILSRDKDLGQLIRREQDYLWDFAKDLKSYAPDIEEKWGVPPEAMADYLALVGDSIDDIPGVPGIGAKTAAALLQAYGSVKGIYANLEALQDMKLRGAKGLGSKLEEHLEQVAMAKTLATIVCDIPLVDSINDLDWRTADIDALEAFCAEQGFSRLASRVNKVFGENV
ncbi:5'-3' exonuclease [Pseudoteredinibacter isoporae]|uniref:5'-3' exonuclease n=1 Tax=Pseudoteredinibacter isoporae TaxID=570281 RepID=A0A7X0JVP8_9GAMM|nr:5'-3' exonuclease H3TH domain-containing protein [Pseudoteredinibacter isoporae]MBB6522340.1 5'-3' exonuclease [Pseudoteredinibacter isoporae]NHO87873.1 flap endonuclease [Pseudoteredinibacter isoporae]NIB23796.1 flap endonuclease [Pseudoteredinibacter isoporae]